MTPAEEKKGQPASSPSMDEILHSIRGVISGDEASGDSDVLELVDIIEEGSMANAVIAAAGELNQEKNEPEIVEKSILDDIDAALAVSNVADSEDVVVTENIAKEMPPEQSAQEDVATVNSSDMAELQKLHEKNAGATKEKEAQPTLEKPLSEDIGSNWDFSQQGSFPTPGAKSLLDDEAAQQSKVSLKEFVNTIREKHADSPHTRGGTSLEDLVIEAMRPFLAEWLSKNLPIIVKKIVEREVKHLIPKEEDDY